MKRRKEEVAAMSKMVKITQDCLEQCQKEFMEALSGGKFPDGKVTFTKTLGTLNRKARVLFKELAWLKMQTLIREFDKEVAWHGVACRGDEPDTYYITDILVYPQEVTGATVTTDQGKYQMWLMGHDDDIFNNIRMQGHSHVNMGVSPSSVDTSLYDRLLEQLDDDMFYIFMIWNKRKDRMVKIYDLKTNVLFETEDVSIEVVADEDGIEKFLKNAREMVVNRPVVSYGHGYPANLSRYDTRYGLHSGAFAGSPKNGGSTPGKTQALTESKDKKKKGRRKGRRKDGYGKNSNVGKAGICTDDVDVLDEQLYESLYMRDYH